MDGAQSFICDTRVELVETFPVGLALGADTKPLFIHIILALDIVELISAVNPGGVGVVDVEVLVLTTFPPAIAKLECESSYAVVAQSHTGGIEVYLLPVVKQHLSLFPLSLMFGDGIEGIGTELRKHDGLTIFLLHILEEHIERVATVAVHTEDIYIFAHLCYDVYVQQVAIAYRYRT